MSWRVARLRAAALVAALGASALGCRTPSLPGPTFARWDKWLPSAILRLCNDYWTGFVVVIDGRGRHMLASKRCTNVSVLVGRHFLMPRDLQGVSARFQQPGWVVAVPLGMAEVRFGARHSLIDLLSVRGDGAEAWPFQQVTPAFDVRLHRPGVGGEGGELGRKGLDRTEDPVYQAGGEQVRMAPPPKGRRLVGKPFPGGLPLAIRRVGPKPAAHDATVILNSSKEGVVVQRAAVVAGASGQSARGWQRICELPCRFQIEPGTYRLRFDGPKLEPSVVDLALRSGENLVQLVPAYSGLKQAGAVTLTLGTLFSVMGGALLVNPNDVPQSGGWGLLGGGLAAMGVGLTLLLVGRTTIELERARGISPPPAPAPARPPPAPTPPPPALPPLAQVTPLFRWSGTF